MSRIREAGDSALLLEMEETIDARVNARAIAVAKSVQARRIPGVRDVVPTYRSVAVFFDPRRTEAGGLRDALVRDVELALEPGRGRTIEVPVTYGGEAGPDLMSVAEWAGLSPAAVAERHAGAEYRVFMVGFLPGFAYLGTVDERIAAPRHRTPRVRVPAGSVGIAGRQTGIYPRESPGGWQIIGRTPLRVFDPSRSPAALFQPGDAVRFAPTSPVHLPPSDCRTAEGSAAGRDRQPPDRIPAAGGLRTVTVIRPGLFTTIQDEGRWGHQASGVPVSGALDLVSHRRANLLVGNTGDAATLEVTLAGPELRFEQAATIAITGADLQPTIDGGSVRVGASMTCSAGSVLRFGERRSGARAYVAFDGGIDVAPVLDSRATHVGAGLGGLHGRALVAGDRLPLGPGAVRRAARATHVPPPARGGARLRILPGPQDDFFPESALELLEGSRFVVTPQSNRMGYRLSGARLPRLPSREMISDATFAGGIQVPLSGEPILLMADRQTTGGYPQIAIVIAADLAAAGQLAPGDWVEFVRCTRAEALAALDEQEAMLGA